MKCFCCDSKEANYKMNGKHVCRKHFFQTLVNQYANGKYFKYKDCCILQFLEDSCNGVFSGQVRKGTDGGFVSCYSCSL